MTPEEFCRWLQGFAELHDERPTEKQWQQIKKHLQTCFVKVTDGEDIKKTMEQIARSAVNRGPTRIC